MSDLIIIMQVLVLLSSSKARITPLSVTRALSGDYRITRASSRVRRVIDEMEREKLLVREANSWYWRDENELEELVLSVIRRNSQIPF